MASPSTTTSASSITFADLLRHHRAAAGLTQEELAERAGLSVDAISTLERGARRTPRKDTVALLATALALPAEDRAAFAAAARRSPASALAATPRTPSEEPIHDGHSPGPTSSAALPHGIVTFLFADIEGSTHLLRQLGGDRYAEVLAELQTLLSSVWHAHAGHELGTQGDRFFAVFVQAGDALEAAAAAQRALAAHRWPEGARVRMRMGVHTAAALLTTGRYVGLEVHRAARIAAAGHGGQVLVSQAVVDEVAKEGQDGAHELPDGAWLRDLGRHRLPDLDRRERLYQLVLPDLPAAFPPLRTLDAWPGLRADLTLVAALTLALLAVVGLLLPLVVPAFPSVVGQVAGAAVLGLVLVSVVARPLRRLEAQQWHDARKGVAAVVSVLLCLSIVVTTLFVTKPTLFVRPQHQGYDFSYTYHHPTRTGGSVVIGNWYPTASLTPIAFVDSLREQYQGLWNGCIVQLPDLTLRLKGWKADQCTQVPTIANGGESLDGRRTTFHIDPRAVWSDGQPITADDFLFAFQLVRDHPLNNWTAPPWSLMQLTKLDVRTVRIDWSVTYGDYLATLSLLTPLPLHAYARGKFAKVYNPKTGAYNAALGQQLLADPSFNTTVPVDNGPFTVRSFVPDERLVLIRNPRFFSNFFHTPAALDQVTFVSTWKSAGPHHDSLKAIDALIAAYQSGALRLADDLPAMNLPELNQRHAGDIPSNEVIISPRVDLYEMAFNQRGVARNARANGGASIFDDLNVRKAFIEAFDRCGAVRVALGIRDCTDSNFFTDQFSAPPATDYDQTITLPRYNPSDAAALLNRAGFPVVDGVRRFKDGTTPFELTLAVSSVAQLAPSIPRQLQQDYAQNLKIRVTVVNAPLDMEPFSNGAFDIGMWDRTDSPDPVGQQAGDLGWDSASIPGPQNPDGTNILGVIDPWVITQDQLGFQTIDDDQRAEVYRELQRHIVPRFYMEPVFIDADVALVKPTLCNFKKWPTADLNTWNMADWYVAPNCT